MATVVVDMPATSVDYDVGDVVDSDVLATPDTATEIVWSDPFQPMFQVRRWGDGAGYINLPAVSGTLTDARLVILAYAASGGDIAPADQPDYDGSETWPYLLLDNTAVSGFQVFDHLPVGSGYAGEALSDFTVRVDAGYQLRDRYTLRGHDFSPPALHVAYLAVRLTFETGASPVVRQWPRDDGLGISSGVRRFPPLKAGRRAGGYT